MTAQSDDIGSGEGAGNSRLAILISMAMFVLVVDTSLEEHVSEAAGVNSAGGSFGLSFGLALAGGIMLATLASTFGSLVEQSAVIPPDQKTQVYTVLEDDAQLMSNTQLEALLADEPEPVADEIVRINTEARPFALQVALLVPLIAGLLGLAASFAMARLPDIMPKASLEGLAFD